MVVAGVLPLLQLVVEQLGVVDEDALELAVDRLRRTGDRELVYIGQTGVRLPTRLGQLTGVYGNQMPYGDPHTAAPALWALHHRDGHIRLG
jgi:hypothetical protein